MISKSILDKRICDCEEGTSNTQTYRQFIMESEEEFSMMPTDLDSCDDEELSNYLDFLDELWCK